MMIPRPAQLEISKLGYEILREHMICYLAMEERTGKTLTSILMAEMCDIRTVLIVTKKKALNDWVKTLAQFPHEKKYNVTNYHQAHKFGRPDLLILDEAHNYISGCPAQPTIHKAIMNISMQIPIIYLSATPHAQGYQMLFHPFMLSSWSPWRRYKTFYKWFSVYGVPSTAWYHGRQVPVYTETDEERIIAETKHLFIAKTRKELDFDHEPVDQKHYIELSEPTKKVYNELMVEKMYEFKGWELICDTSMKLRTSLHMLEGGVAKTTEIKLRRSGKPYTAPTYRVLNNNEKIEYILKTWGDTDDLVIYYHYIAEGRKLRKVFQKATILQSTSDAEGIDLAHKETIVIYSQDFSTARHTQRRARQAAEHRDKPITVHFLLVKKAVSEQVYNIVSVNKMNFVDSVFERNYL